MKNSSRRTTFLVFSLTVLALLLGSSLAEAQMREFTGRIDRVSKKRMIVDNRMGDKVSFVPAENTEVTGEGKSEDWGLDVNDVKIADIEVVADVIRTRCVSFSFPLL